MRARNYLLLGMLLAAVTVAGCNRSTESVAPQPGAGKKIDGTKYALATEPAAAKGVIQVREQAKDGDTVVVVGRVGGSKRPYVTGRAAFTCVDPSVVTCEDRPMNCETPWCYCHIRRDELVRATAMIKFVDEQGKTVEQDAKEFLGVEPLQTIVVHGRAKRDENGNLTVLADGIYIRPSNK